MEILPKELIIHVAKFLPTTDLINFTSAFEEYKFLFRESSVIQSINLNKAFELYNLNICDLFKKTIACEKIRSLNINGIYWIPAVNLRQCIRKMVNLECLLAIDTKLGFAQSDCKLYENLMLKKVGLTEDYRNRTLHQVTFPVLETFLLKCDFIGLGMLMSFRINLIDKMYKLREFWIVQANKYVGYIVPHLPGLIPKLRRYVIKLPTPSPDLDVRGMDFPIYYRNSLGYTEKWFEKNSRECNKTELAIEPIYRSWEVVWSLNMDKPFGVNDSRQLNLKLARLCDIIFEELNFMHSYCFPEFNSAIIEILSQKKQVQKLKRLAIKTCLFQKALFKFDNNEGEIQQQNSVLSMKRKRCGIPMKETDPNFKKLFEGFQDLEELEIWICQRNKSIDSIYGYPLISHFTNLKKLTIEFNAVIDGSFLSDVFKNSKHLESFRLFCNTFNEKLNINLYKSIKYANNLKDFRCECIQINWDRLFAALTEIPNKTIQRIFIKCDTLPEPFSMASLKDFLTNQPQLVCLIILVKKLTQEIMRAIKRVLSEAKNNNPAKIFLAKNDLDNLRGGYDIPFVHHYIIFAESVVSTIDIYRDF